MQERADCVMVRVNMSEHNIKCALKGKFLV